MRPRIATITALALTALTAAPAATADTHRYPTERLFPLPHHQPQHHRRRPRHRPYRGERPWTWPTTTASWFDDGPALACAPHRDEPAVASTSLPCGAHATLWHAGHRARVVVEDYGPDPSLDRGFDLNLVARDALDCPDLCEVHYRDR